MRACGVLLPIFSLPSKYGIGCCSKEAYDFVDFLKKAGQKYWQILPIGPTGYGDSPYQSFSTFAMNPYFIDVDKLAMKGWLTENECNEYSADNGEWIHYIKYEKLYYQRYKLLRIAYERSNINTDSQFADWTLQNAYWLDDYALYMAVKAYFANKAFYEWDDDIRLRKPEAVELYRNKLCDEVCFYKFMQYVAYMQWMDLKAYATENGIEIIGDIPIYVAKDSADVWANPELFDLDEDNVPTAVAGCPPDYFAATGQLWGNPLYKWDYHKKTGYEWWVQRVSHCYDLYDVVRIDHFRGFDEYYAIPYGDKTAEFGEWRKGPSNEIFDVMRDRLGERKIIAEDLGMLTDSVRELVKTTGYPGMKVLLFAFDSDSKCEYLPHNLCTNSTVYTGTHDNETVRGWYKRISEEGAYSKKFFDDYTGTACEEDAASKAILAVMTSISDTAIIPIQDYLNLDNSARINTPSTLGNNWSWRLGPDDLTDALAERMRRLAEISGRCHN